MGTEGIISFKLTLGRVLFLAQKYKLRDTYPPLANLLSTKSSYKWKELIPCMQEKSTYLGWAGLLGWPPFGLKSSKRKMHTAFRTLAHRWDQQHCFGTLCHSTPRGHTKEEQHGQKHGQADGEGENEGRNWGVLRQRTVKGDGMLPNNMCHSFFEQF